MFKLNVARMSIPGRGKWAWERYRLEPTLWDLMYHGDPFQHIANPRAAVVRRFHEDAPQIGEPLAPFFAPKAVQVDNQAQRGRVRHDIEVYELTFGR
jgi:hypothetical protein